MIAIFAAGGFMVWRELAEGNLWTTLLLVIVPVFMGWRIYLQGKRAARN